MARFQVGMGAGCTWLALAICAVAWVMAPAGTAENIKLQMKRVIFENEEVEEPLKPLAKRSLFGGARRHLLGDGDAQSKCDYKKRCKSKDDKIIKGDWLYGDYKIYDTESLWYINVKERLKQEMEFFLLEEDEYDKFRKEKGFKFIEGTGCKECLGWKTEYLLRQYGIFYYVMSAMHIGDKNARSIDYDIEVNPGANATHVPMDDEDPTTDIGLVLVAGFVLCWIIACALGLTWWFCFRKGSESDEEKREKMERDEKRRQKKLAKKKAEEEGYSKK